MSKANLLTYKRTPLASIAAKQKLPNQLIITHRDAKDDDSQKLYTFCSSQQKQAAQAAEEESRDISRERKISFNNTRGKVYQPLSKSKGKTVSQANIHKERRKDVSSYTINNTSAVLNTSALPDRRKTEKLTARDEKHKEDNRINISINLSRNCFNEPANKENKLEINTAQERAGNEKKQLFEAVREKEGEGGKKMIVMSEEELHNFTKKQAADKVRLEQRIEQLEESISSWEEKEGEWKLFKKDSEDYIKYLSKEKQAMLSHCQALQEELNALSSDKEYHQIAKDEYRTTIREQEAEIHELKQQLADARGQISTLQEQAKKRTAERQAENCSAPLELLEIENSHLKKELEINEKHQSVRSSQRLDLQQLQKELTDLRLANQILSDEIRETYIFKLKCDVFQKALEESTATIARLTQDNDSLRAKLKDSKSKAERSEIGDFEFRLDTSPHSPSEVEVVWKREPDEEKTMRLGSQVQDYFDHDFFSNHP